MLTEGKNGFDQIVVEYGYGYGLTNMVKDMVFVKLHALTNATKRSIWWKRLDNAFILQHSPSRVASLSLNIDQKYAAIFLFYIAPAWSWTQDLLALIPCRTIGQRIWGKPCMISRGVPGVYILGTWPIRVLYNYNKVLSICSKYNLKVLLIFDHIRRYIVFHSYNRAISNN
jgi:hypothetical protein